MRALSYFIRFVRWLFDPPCPAIDIGAAMIAAGWCLALMIDPGFLSLPTFQSLNLVRVDVLITLMCALALTHAFAVFRPAWRSAACLASAFVWLTVAAGFVVPGAWTGVSVYATLGAGSLLAAIYAEAVRA